MIRRAQTIFLPMHHVDVPVPYYRPIYNNYDYADELWRDVGGMWYGNGRYRYRVELN